jgi:TonB family protein
MSKRKNDIERYLRGEMTSSEMYDLEKEALKDPFLSEALEGVDQAGRETFLFDLKELHNTLHQKTRARKPKLISMWNWSLGIAAGLILLAVSSVYIISSINKKQSEQRLSAIEEKTSSENAPPLGDSAETRKDDQLLSLNSAEKKPAPDTKFKTNDSQRQKQPVSAPAVATTRDEAEKKSLEVAQSETRETEDQRIVETDLTEAPKETVSADKPQTAAEKKKSESLASRSEASRKITSAAALRVIQGKVTSSEDGSALPGVNVLVKGTSVGTVTDAEGNYQITLSDPKQSLEFAFIGMKPVEVSPGSKTDVNVLMSPDYAQLSEVVVTGSGADARAADADNATLELAEPQGGRGAFQKYLEEQMQYPQQALEHKVEGRVTVQFTVGANGQLEDFKVIKGIGYGCDDEVIRLIKEGPAWSPSKRNEKPVTEKVKVRLKFDIPDKK